MTSAALLLIACTGESVTQAPTPTTVPTPPAATPTPDPPEWELRCSQSYVPPPLIITPSTPILQPPARMEMYCSDPLHIVPHPELAEHFLIWSTDVADMVVADCPRVAAVFQCGGFVMRPDPYTTWEIDHLTILPWEDDGSGVGTHARIRLESFWVYERGTDLQGERQGGLLETTSFPAASDMALEVGVLLRPGVRVRWVGESPLASSTVAVASSGGESWEMDPYGNDLYTVRYETLLPDEWGAVVSFELEGQWLMGGVADSTASLVLPPDPGALLGNPGFESTGGWLTRAADFGIAPFRFHPPEGDQMAVLPCDTLPSDVFGYFDVDESDSTLVFSAGFDAVFDDFVSASVDVVHPNGNTQRVWSAAQATAGVFDTVEVPLQGTGRASVIVAERCTFPEGVIAVDDFHLE